MSDFAQNYLLAFDEINALTSTSFYSATGNVDQIADDILSFLINAYRLGIKNVSEMLHTELKVDTDRMAEAIYLIIEGKTFEDRVADHVRNDDIQGLRTLAESEFHRVYNTGAQDGAKEFQASEGLGVVKHWYTQLDDRVRETHDYLEGQTVSVDEDFYTFDGDHAPFPGGFANASNNVNCRCLVKYEIDAEQV